MGLQRKKEFKIGFGGGCHWCTEAVFNSLKGIENVDQGWIASSEPNHSMSEAVIVFYNDAEIDLHTLVSIHLYTHSCTSNHSLREKYRSAIYYFDEQQRQSIGDSLCKLQGEFDLPIITQAMPFLHFKLNEEKYLNYLYNKPEAAFCQNFIYPKLSVLMKKFGKHVHLRKLEDHDIRTT